MSSESGIAELRAEIKVLEAKLKKAEDSSFLHIFEEHPVCMLLIHPDTGKILRANASAASFYGLSIKELEASTISRLNLLTENDISGKMKQALMGGKHFFEFQHRLACGTVRTVQVDSIPVSYKDDVALWSMIRDVSPQVESNQYFQNHLSLFESILDVIPAPLFFRDTTGRFLGCNRSFCQFVGIAREELEGRRLEDFLDAEQAEHYSRYDCDILRGQSGIQYDIEVKDCFGDTRIFSTYKSVYYDGKGLCSGVASVLFDVTALRQATAELEKAKARAENGYKTKSKLILAVSHELRTPLSAIMGILSLARTEPDQSVVSQLLKDGEAAAKHLYETVENLLDHSQLEAGIIQLKPSPFLIRDIAEPLQRGMKSLAEEKDLKFYYDCVVSDYSILNNDSYFFSRVLFNLLDNAVQYTEKGEIHLKITDAGGGILVKISDSGPGISKRETAGGDSRFPAPDLNDESFVKTGNGLGLGLELASRFISLMGGWIEVDSRVGKGTEFTFFTPALNWEVKESREHLSMTNRKIPSLNILVVEDCRMNRTILEKRLKMRGHTVIVAEHGLEALNILEKHDEIQVVLMDIYMPVMDGLQTTAAIRENKEQKFQNSNIPIIALTAFSNDEEREHFRGKGMNRVLAKPVNMDSLDFALGEYFGEESRGDEMELQYCGSKESIFCWEEGLAATGGDRDLFEEVLSLFCGEVEEKLEKLTRYLSTADLKTAAVIVHGIKGNAMSIGAGRLCIVARKFEKELRLNRIPENCECTLRAEMQAVVNEILMKTQSLL
jgi:two-component system sensor histidine kinase EvgS